MRRVYLTLLLAFSLATVGLFAAWLWLTRGEPPHRPAVVHGRPPIPWRSRFAWLLVALFGLMGMWYYGVNAWLPDAYVERGWSEHEAGALLAVLNIAALPSSVAIPWLSDRYGAYPVLVLAFAGIAVDAAVLASIAPTPRIVPITIACLSLAVFLGAGSGAVFKLVPAEFPNDAGAAAGLVGTAGGLGGFFPPLVMGIVKDVTGEYTLGFVGLLVSFPFLYLSMRIAREFESQDAALEAPAA